MMSALLAVTLFPDHTLVAGNAYLGTGKDSGRGRHGNSSSRRDSCVHHV
jgi:hypothetical protein